VYLDLCLHKQARKTQETHRSLAVSLHNKRTNVLRDFGLKITYNLLYKEGFTAVIAAKVVIHFRTSI